MYYYIGTEATNPKRDKIMTNRPTPYESEVLTSLYASLDFMQCNDLPCEDVKQAISTIESKYR